MRVKRAQVPTRSLARAHMLGAGARGREGRGPRAAEDACSSVGDPAEPCSVRPSGRYSITGQLGVKHAGANMEATQKLGAGGMKR